MTINVRAKGANGEREVADLLQKVVNEVALNCGYTAPRIRRNVEQTQVGGEDLVGLPWYSFEIKRVERVDLDKWWEQTCVQARRKAPGATSWDALAKGGWRRLGASQGGDDLVRAGRAQQEATAAPGSVLEAADGQAVGRSEARAGGTVQAVGGLALPRWAGGSMGGLLGALERLDVPRLGGPVAAGGSREPVLVWRQNKRPWYVRAVLDVRIGAKTRQIVSDVFLDDWLEVFRSDLGDLLRG